MHLCSLNRGMIPPVLFGLLFALIPRMQAPRAYYATLGPEAPSILRVLIGAQAFVEVEPGHLAEALKQHHITTLIAPVDWADETDLNTAHAAGLTVVSVQRHNGIFNIEENIRTLEVLTDTREAGTRLIDSIERGVASILLLPKSHARVLVLSPEAYTQGQGALITNLITIAGGINVAAEAGIPEAREVEDEQIRQFSPDVVLLIEWTPHAALSFAHSTVYQGLPAIDRYRLYRIVMPGKDPAYLVEDLQHLYTLINVQQF